MLHSVLHALFLQQHISGNYILIIYLFFTRNFHFIANKMHIFICTYQNLYFCLLLPTFASSNCTHIIDGIDDLPFSCCICFIQQWIPFNSPSSTDIFAMMSYCVFTVTCNMYDKLLVSTHLLLFGCS